MAQYQRPSTKQMVEKNSKEQNAQPKQDTPLKEVMQDEKGGGSWLENSQKNTNDWISESQRS